MAKRFFLRQSSAEATVADVQVAHDLKDTLQAHRATCVGMAANMIGERKRIIAVVGDEEEIIVMLNPEIVSTEGAYDAEEGCLSLSGTRETRRFQRIVARWQDESMVWHEGAFEGRAAQAIQHEVDHCNGVLI